ncbi:MAG: Lrp/AsnC family transcriptional regulator [Candidatus Nanopelagicales bacterium]
MSAGDDQLNDAESIPVLDDTNRSLIDALRGDGRMGLAALGAEVGLSGDAVRERLRRLTQEGVVKVTCSLDPRLLGFSTLALLGVNATGPAEQIAEELADVPEFDLVGCTAGRFDLFVEAVCRDERHLLQTVDRHLRSRADVASVTSFNYLEVQKFSPSGTPSTDRVPDNEVPHLSDSELEVIAVLQEDGRASFQDIADRTGVSYQMARRRAKALLDSGVVRVETVVNRLVEGTAVVAAVGLRTSGPIRQITPRIIELPEVEVAVLTTGPFDLLLDVACRDRAHLAEFAGEILPSIPGVESTETTIYQRFTKLPQSWSGLVRQTQTT